MLNDKNGKEISLDQALGYLTGTDDSDLAQSVMDFALYSLNEQSEMGDVRYYLVASEAIITNISFMGPFVMVELDFRTTGISILQQVMKIISQFHKDVNKEQLVLLSTVTSLNKESTHVLSLVNPLMCVRGFSEEGNGSTIMQLVYSAENVIFSTCEIDYDKIDAEVSREVYELQSLEVTKEALAAAQETLEDENDVLMKNLFKPEFGLGIRTAESKKEQALEGVRVVNGDQAEKIGDKGDIVNSEKEKIKNVHNID